MKLTALKSRLSTIGGRLSDLPIARPNVVERKRGSAGVKDRERIKRRDCGVCQNCGHLGQDVDHDIPLWAGAAAGGTDDESNKRLLCPVCHEAKTKVEAGQRASGRYDREAVLVVMRQMERERRLV